MPLAEQFAQPLVRRPFLLARDGGEFGVLGGIMVARHGFGDVDLGLEEAVNIARRHAAIGGDFRHCGFAVAIMLDARDRGLKDAVAGVGLFVHDAKLACIG